MSISREELLDAVDDAFEAQGYETAAQFHEAAFQIVEPAVAPNLKARSSAALQRRTVMSRTWPLVDAPEDIPEDDPEREMKLLVHKELNKRTWALTAPLTGRLQSMMEQRNGYVVCRLGGLRGDSVYVTADPDCFRVDVIESRSNKDIAAVTKLASFYGRVSKRIPAMAPTIAESFEASLQGVLAAGRAQIPALQGSTGDE